MATSALSHPESHSHLPFLNAIAVTFNVAVSEKIECFAFVHEHRTINSTRRAALGPIEGEIPATTAGGTVMYHEVASKVDMECGVCVLFHKVTALH